MSNAPRTLVRDLHLNPGDVLLLRIEGFVGLMVDVMQRINRDSSYWTHAAIVLDDDTVFEAQPGGAVITPLSKYLDRPGTVVSYYQRPKPGNPKEYELQPLSNVIKDHHRAGIVRDARAVFEKGYRYAWSTYFYLALARFGFRPNWVKWAVQQPDQGICSQVCDLILADNTIHLFADGRMPYDVTPGDLGTLALP
ncbi:cysteine protease [Streptomyces phage Keanu]|nr:cysteine protease [Streptomyces phage Keanu]